MKLRKQMNDGLQEVRGLLLNDFLSYLKYFFKLIFGRDLIIPNPPGRIAHVYIVSHKLSHIALQNMCERWEFAMPPGYGKSTFVCFWVSWCWARWPRSMFLYLSYNKMIATKCTYLVKQIVSRPEYRALFGIYINNDMRAKDYFKNNFGGQIYGAGITGAVTGMDAGLPGLGEFSGALIIDDAHKADEVHSDTIRDNVIQTYQQTITTRVRGINVPVIYIGHMLHERDLPSLLMEGIDGYKWGRIALPALDEAGNPLYPEKDTKEALERMREVNEYTFYSQYQQCPIPSGGALYKRKHFILLDEEPKFITTFITCDTAETDKNYNDASVFSFWGLYRLDNGDKYCLQWIDCKEIRVEPYLLEGEFLGFWHKCQLHSAPPKFAAIERKSTGVTLLSILDNCRGLEVRPIERHGGSGSKTSRFISMQYYIGEKLISLPSYAEHTASTIDHMCKITANESHAFDDRADTLYDAIKIGLMDKSLINSHNSSTTFAAKMISDSLANQLSTLRKSYYGN